MYVYGDPTVVLIFVAYIIKVKLPVLSYFIY